MKARTASIIAEGLVAGVLAHIAIALVLGLADLFAGRWLFLLNPVASSPAGGPG